MGEVTSDDVADCIQREWAAARARDAEGDAATGRGVGVRARGAVGRHDAGGTKRQRPTDDGRGGGRADVERRPTKPNRGMTSNQRKKLKKMRRREETTAQTGR